MEIRFRTQPIIDTVRLGDSAMGLFVIVFVIEQRRRSFELDSMIERLHKESSIQSTKRLKKASMFSLDS